MNAYRSYLKRQEKQKAYEISDEVLTEWMTNADIAILHTLHTEFGFGAERCARFYKKMVENHRDMSRFRIDGDEGHYLVMLARLKADGIDVEALQKEVADL